MKEKITRVVITSLFLAVFSANISLAYTPNASYTDPNGTVWTGLLVNMFGPSNNTTSAPTGGSPSGSVTVPNTNTQSGVGSCRLGQARNFRELIINLVIGCILSPIVYLIMAASVVAFLFGVFKFIKAEGDDKQSGREFILWGLVGLFVMVSIWGLVSILSNTFILSNSSINFPALTP